MKRDRQYRELYGRRIDRQCGHRGEGQTDWERVDTMTEMQLEKAIASDPGLGRHPARLV